jgi:hypothetical protein
MVPGRIILSEVKARGLEMEEVGVRKLGIQDKLFEIRDGRGVDKQMGWQDSDILVIEGAIVVVRVARQVIGLIGGAGLVDKFKVELSHFREIASDPVADLLWVAIIFQV